MEDFVYHRPASVEEAQALFAGCNDAAFMSGGMTLVPTMKQGLALPTDVIDLSGSVSQEISVGGSHVTIGARARHAEMEAALSVDFSPEAIAGITTDPGQLNEDIHATGAYRAHLITIMAGRAVAAALAGGGKA